MVLIGIDPYPNMDEIPSGKLTVCYGKSPCLMGKSTISMAIFYIYINTPHIFWVKVSAPNRPQERLQMTGAQARLWHLPSRSHAAQLGLQTRQLPVISPAAWGWLNYDSYLVAHPTNRKWVSSPQL